MEGGELQASLRERERGGASETGRARNDPRPRLPARSPASPCGEGDRLPRKMVFSLS